MTLANLGQEITVGGRTIRLKLATGIQVIRLLKLLETIKDRLGLTAEELGKMEFDYRTIATLFARAHAAITEDVDLENTDPLDPAAQMGPLARLVYREVGALFGLTAEEFASLSVSEQYDLIKAQVALEEGTALGNVIRATFARITSFLKLDVTASVPTRSPTGSATPSGSTASSAPSAEDSPPTPPKPSSTSPSSASSP